MTAFKNPLWAIFLFACSFLIIVSYAPILSAWHHFQNFPDPVFIRRVRTMLTVILVIHGLYILSLMVMLGLSGLRYASTAEFLNYMRWSIIPGVICYVLTMILTWVITAALFQKVFGKTRYEQLDQMAHTTFLKCGIEMPIAFSAILPVMVLIILLQHTKRPKHASQDAPRGASMV